MTVHVCLGPTVAVAEARELLEAEYHPPVRAGDICRLLERRPSVIALIDGYFEQVLSVFHKEILRALADGVRVYGASSMGALRAAELHPFGMIGVGRVFEAYRSGEIEDDDEVALCHGSEEHGYRALSDAMVNLRFGLSAAAHAGIIQEDTQRVLVSLAKEQFYADRSWRALFVLGRRTGVDDVEIQRLAAFVDRTHPDIKKEDALLLLRTIASDVASGIERAPASFDFEPTIFWERLVSEVIGLHSSRVESTDSPA